MDVRKVEAAYGVNHISKANKTDNVKHVTPTMGKDKVSLTGVASDFKLALNAAREVSDVREDLVNDIKERMDNGTYEYDMDALIEKMVSKK